EAEEELDLYVGATSVRAVGQRAYEHGAELRRKAVTDAEATLRKLAGQEASVEQLPSADQLDDPEKFAAALRAMVSRIAVHPAGGRGLARVPVEFRVELRALYD